MNRVFGELAVKIEEAIRKIHDTGIIPVVRAANLDEARKAIDAILAGGIRVIEVTMTVPGAPTVIEGLSKHYGSDLLTGAGTVTSSAEAQTCFNAGARFLVSPGLSIPVLETAFGRGMLAIPGALTPTEVMAAQDAGARIIKIFPCGSVGGPSHIKSLKAPFPEARLVPTGGVNLGNAAQYFAVGAFALGVGADLVDLEAIRRNELSKITGMARSLSEIVREARLAKP
jgi:2-dehydro-3-deoxyphosphogluconate aldolase/(4S)-4-hydroxy-2-oxoglutarate aldolase